MEAVGEKVPDMRRARGNLKYRLLHGIKSACAVFFFLHPSLLDFQREMKEKRKRDNLETLFGVTAIPRDNQIRTLLDGIEPSVMGEASKVIPIDKFSLVIGMVLAFVVLKETITKKQSLEEF